MRDHRKLEVFALADALAIRVYRITRTFPDDERYGLSSQLRRAAVSVGANIVEGAARSSDADFLRMLTIAYSSACEVEYEISLTERLGYTRNAEDQDLHELAYRTCRALASLIRSIQTRAAR